MPQQSATCYFELAKGGREAVHGAGLREAGGGWLAGWCFAAACQWTPCRRRSQAASPRPPPRGTVTPGRVTRVVELCRE